MCVCVLVCVNECFCLLMFVWVGGWLGACMCLVGGWWVVNMCVWFVECVCVHLVMCVCVFDARVGYGILHAQARFPDHSCH